MSEPHVTLRSLRSRGEALPLLAGALRGNAAARDTFATLLERLDDGRYDEEFRQPVPDPDTVGVTTSCHLLALALLHRVLGITAAEFYKGQPRRYVRANLLVQALLGFNEPTLGWPVYAFGAEALGQVMMYPQDQPPGSDPGAPLISLRRPEMIPRYDPGHEIACLVRRNLRLFADLTGRAPVAHLPAPYSFAAEVAGQEAILSALHTEPASVIGVLDGLVDNVLIPWCEDLVREIPGVWLELSDASGSPMFVGPRNFMDIALPPVRRMTAAPAWGARVFVANYRGDNVATTAGRANRNRRRRVRGDVSVPFEVLLEMKRGVCPQFMTKLDADRLPMQVYATFCAAHRLPLYAGVGAACLDRNAVAAPERASSSLREDARAHGLAILEARRRSDGSEWPGGVYVEDTNAVTDFALLGAVFEGVAAAEADWRATRRLTGSVNAPDDRLA